jgi:hypothetical protein
MDEFNLGPFTRLANELDLTPEDIFGNVGGQQSGSNPFGNASNASGEDDLLYNGNPFAGDNFWNIFAGGVNPSYQNQNSGDPFANNNSGSNNFGGNNNPFGGDFGSNSSGFGGDFGL